MPTTPSPFRSSPSSSSVATISSGVICPTVPASFSALLVHEASVSLVLVQLADVHEADVHDALVQLADVHEADVQDALVHEAEVHEALVQLAEVHDAEVHEALVQEAPSCAALVQLAASKSVPPVAKSETRNWSSPAFGLGGETRAAARAMSISPTPTDSGAAAGVALTVIISAPLTWPGVQVGCSASSTAA